MRYKYIRDLVWMSMEPLHRYACLFINVHKIALQKQTLKFVYLAYG